MLPGIARAVAEEAASGTGARSCEVIARGSTAMECRCKSVTFHLEVWMDGGIRSGQDVFKAVALGAKGVVSARCNNRCPPAQQPLPRCQSHKSQKSVGVLWFDPLFADDRPPLAVRPRQLWRCWGHPDARVNEACLHLHLNCRPQHRVTASFLGRSWFAPWAWRASHACQI